MGLKVVTPPEVEPVTLIEAKAHLRVDITADDIYISMLITAAQERVEMFLRRALITQAFEYTLDHFPGNAWLVHSTSIIDLPRPPLQSVEWVRYVDTAGQTQTLPPANYVADSSSNEIGRVALAWNQFWPVTRFSINAVVIRFKAGYGDAGSAVPQAIRHGILIELSNLYENREDIVVGQSVNMLPVSERLLWPFRALAAV